MGQVALQTHANNNMFGGLPFKDELFSDAEDATTETADQRAAANVRARMTAQPVAPAPPADAPPSDEPGGHAVGG